MRMSGRAVISSGLAPNRRLGRYTVVDCIGRGGMGEVWLATVDGPGGFRKQVVLKTVRPDLAERGDLVDMLIREAALAARLSHPNLVQVFDLDCVTGTYFFAMEYVPGRPLTQVLRHAALAAGPRLASGSGRMPAVTALSGTVAPWFLSSVLASACDGLHHAHTLVGDDGKPLGLVHRDVSPGNIMVAATGNVVVLDFGIAIAGASSTTQTGVLKGKFQYMSPERIRGEPCDRRCDVYALGVILYLGLCGHPPFASNGEYDLLQQIVSGPPPPPSSHRAGIPVALERICLTAMAHDPARRYRDAAGLAVDLRDWLHAQGERPTPDDVARYVATVFGELPPAGPPRPPTDLGVDDADAQVDSVEVEESAHGRLPTQVDDPPPPPPPPAPRPAPLGEGTRSASSSHRSRPPLDDDAPFTSYSSRSSERAHPTTSADAFVGAPKESRRSADIFDEGPAPRNDASTRWPWSR